MKYAQKTTSMKMGTNMKIDAIKLADFISALYNLHINHGSLETCRVINEISSKVNQLMMQELTTKK